MLERDLATLFAPLGPPVRRIEMLAPVSHHHNRPPGKPSLDFGQNLVGRLRLSVQGPAGQTITLRHAEVLENGELCTAPAARRQSHRPVHPARASGVETWEPRFTFHGFRYAEVERLARRTEAAKTSARWSAIRIWSAPAGLNAPTRWSTACTKTWSGACAATSSISPPTARSATSAWAGPATSRSSRPPLPSCTTAAGFLTSWLADLAAEQKDCGVVPFVVPNVLPGTPTRPPRPGATRRSSCPGCSTSALAIPKFLADQFESMRAWVDLLDRTAGESRLWDTGLPVWRLARPGCPAGQARRSAHARVPSSPPPTLPARPSWSGRRPACWGAAEEEAHYRALAARGARGLQPRIRHPRRAPAERFGHRLRAGPAVCPAARRADSASTPGSAWPTWCAPAATASAPVLWARR